MRLLVPLQERLETLLTTNNLSTIVDAIITRIRSRHTELGLVAQNAYKPPNEYGVFFGLEQSGFGPLPVVLVEPGDKRKRLEGTSRRTLNEFRVEIMMLHCNVNDARSKNRRDALLRAENLELILQGDLQLGGLVIQSYVTSIAAGRYFTKNGLVYSHLLEWWGMTKTMIQTN